MMDHDGGLLVTYNMFFCCGGYYNMMYISGVPVDLPDCHWIQLAPEPRRCLVGNFHREPVFLVGGF